MAWRPLAILLVLTGTAWAAPIVIKCYDGSASAVVRGPNRTKLRLGICDLDHHLDGRGRKFTQKAGLVTLAPLLVVIPAWFRD